MKKLSIERRIKREANTLADFCFDNGMTRRIITEKIEESLRWVYELGLLADKKKEIIQ